MSMPPLVYSTPMAPVNSGMPQPVNVGYGTRARRLPRHTLLASVFSSFHFFSPVVSSLFVFVNDGKQRVQL